MSIGLPEIKLLWGRAGGLCSICKIQLSEDKKASNGAFPFGEQAHIVAEEQDGPRGKSTLNTEQRNSYPNLILLCPTCHTKIDKTPEQNPIELLHHLKSEHELWLEKSRVTGADRQKQAGDFIYAEIVDAAAKLCMFEKWETWTEWALGTEPAWQRDWFDNITEFRRRVIRVVWPGTIPELERALQTLSLNLVMASKVFWEHSESAEDNWIKGARFYRSSRGELEYDNLLALYNLWIDRQMDYLFEATKSANWVAEIVRRELNPLFFAVPGKFVVRTGPDFSGALSVTRVVEYSDDEKMAQPQALLAKLKAIDDEEQASYKELLR